MRQFNDILAYCNEVAFDLNFTKAKEWKIADKNRALLGFLPIYFPREITHAANGLAVGLMGVGDRKQIIKGDAYYQSYICHLPRGIIEMALDNSLDAFDGFVFPAICDCVRNLSGMFKLAEKGKFQRYFDYPQNFDSLIGGVFYRQELHKIIEDTCKVNGVRLTTENLNHSISLFNKNRKLIEEIYNIRQEYPWRLSAVDTYLIIRAGLAIPVEEHNQVLEEVVEIIS